MLDKIDSEIKTVLKDKFGITNISNPFGWASHSQESMCDATSTVALSIWRRTEVQTLSNENNWQNPVDLAGYLGEYLKENLEIMKMIELIEVVTPGYINIKFNKFYWWEKMNEWENTNIKLIEEKLVGQKIMIEYGHPNTHKEMHVGHLRTLVTGESLAKLAEALGGNVIRANYQGDIGPHVAKALYGVRHLIDSQNFRLDEIESRSLVDKAKFLGEAYVLGNQEYENNKEEISNINTQLYNRDENIFPLYLQTRSWSLDYFKSIYDRLGTKYDKLYFETNVADKGKEIVLENIGDIFEVNQGATIFKGEKYGLHTRVFITSAGTPTYEAKEMALAIQQYDDYKFDLNLHVVANEQTEYFKVVFKALELLNDDIAKRENHIAMGMVNLVGMKISSRTGVIVTVNQLLDLIKEAVDELLSSGDSNDNDNIAEALTQGALKFAMLKQSTNMSIALDVKQSVSLLGFTGPYLQYTYARCKSLLDKSEINRETKLEMVDLADEEKALLFWLNQYASAIYKSWSDFSLHHLCEYLHELAQRFNLLYNNLPILNSDINNKNLRLMLTKETSKRLSKGLGILGIEVLERL